MIVARKFMKILHASFFSLVNWPLTRIVIYFFSLDIVINQTLSWSSLIMHVFYGYCMLLSFHWKMILSVPLTLILLRSHHICEYDPIFQELPKKKKSNLLLHWFTNGNTSGNLTKWSSQTEKTGLQCPGGSHAEEMLKISTQLKKT